MYESTADVVQLAWKVAANPKDTKADNQLRVKCDKWSEQLDIVRATVDKLVNPWSVSASCVVQAVTLKDQHLYTNQVRRGLRASLWQILPRIREGENHFLTRVTTWRY